ncbi:TraB/GumN family protein [Echinicola marina]|uniref:TraB/GumN family protein n=1 Tax=Echinicola marina TaxID=2859768 RepID=UPI001CF64729|nr:TraB/GumN family protein [Echinicola marina]UCS94263.1 TraB/GumN family protein [Echinicola marina]
MKFRIIITILLLPLSLQVFGQNSKPKNEDIPPTILWKITGKDINQTSYLLGIHHLVSANWLYNFPEIKYAIENSDYLLTELYGENIDTTPLPENNIKALDILTPEEFNILDSFFIARVGEGIVDNEVAEEMNVFDMCSGILSTLMTSTESKELPSMDRELFSIFQHQGKPTYRMDKIEYHAIGINDTARAREVIKPMIELAKLGSLSALDLEDTVDTQGLVHIIKTYKKMTFKYKLEEADPQEKSLISRLSVKERNRLWLPTIVDKISKYDCLVAVGAYHLLYNTGLISHLRAKGYTVEAIALRKE